LVIGAVAAALQCCQLMMGRRLQGRRDDACGLRAPHTTFGENLPHFGDRVAEAPTGVIVTPIDVYQARPDPVDVGTHPV
jgi:hypothetical protein